MLPDDQLTGKNRGMVDWKQNGKMVWAASGQSVTSYDLRWRRVSDDDYWKDFTHNLPSTTPRLYDSHLHAEHQLNSRAWGWARARRPCTRACSLGQNLKDLDPGADPPW